MQQHLGLSWLISSILLNALTAISQAQSIQTDGTTPTTPNNCTGSCIVDGGTQYGNNLFHSFERFNVDEGTTVLFQDPGVANIISRVTGTDPSHILGTLGVTQGNANLFLMNPNGIIFGKNSSLDVQGSFVATTANAIQFGDRGFFSASTSNVSPLLTINPSALLFNQIPNGRIENYSTTFISSGDVFRLKTFGLQVPNGQSLLLVGGNVILDGRGLNAFGGRVELGGLAEPGIVSLTVDNNHLNLNFPENVTRANILLTNNASVNVSGGGGGSITINAQDLSISNSRLDAGTRELGSENSQARDITFIARGTVIIRDGSQVSNVVPYKANGNGGDIRIEARELFLKDRSGVYADSFGQGNTGNIFVQVADAVSLESGSFIVTFRGSEPEIVGNGGNIEIVARELSLSNQSLVYTRTVEGNKVGNVFVQVADDISLESDSLIGSSVDGLTIQQPGEVRIYARSLSLTNGAQISTIPLSNISFDTIPFEFSKGLVRGGNIIVNVSDFVNISGSSESGSFSGLFTVADPRTIGQAGNITVNTRMLTISDGAQVNASSQGLDPSGNIDITANSIFLNGGSITATTIATQGEEGANIKLQVSNLLLLENGSQISATASDDAKGGNINIDTRFLIALPPTGSEGSDITADAEIGNGGRITINADAVLGIEARSQQTQFNDITTRSEFGLSGEVIISDPNVNPQQTLEELPENVVNVSRLVTQNLCKVARGSQFTVAGRGGLPDSPNQLFNSDDTWEDWRVAAQPVSQTTTIEQQPITNRQHQKIVEAQGWVMNEQGKIVLTANPVTATPHNPVLTQSGCR